MSILFSKRIQDLRKEHELTQSSVASFLGVARSTYAKYETGISQPDYSILSRLASFYNVSTDFLLGSTDDPRRMQGKSFSPTLQENILKGIQETIKADPDGPTARALKRQAQKAMDKGYVATRAEDMMGIPLNEDELRTLLSILKDPEAMVMFRDFASMGEKDRRTLLKIWKAMVDDDKE